MKSPLPRLGLIVLLATSFVTQASVDPIPYYIAGAASNEFLAKPMGKWVAQDLLALNKTNPLTSIVGQDLKFVFASAFQSWLSYALPALGKLPDVKGSDAVSAILKGTSRSERPDTPMVSTENVMRMVPSSSSLPALDKQASMPRLSAVSEMAEGKQSVEMTPLSSSSTSMSSTSSASSTVSPSMTSQVGSSAKSTVVAAGSTVGNDMVKKHNAELTKVFKAGAKYIAISEFVEYLAKIAEEWEKIHPAPKVVITHNNQTALIPAASGCALPDALKTDPRAWIEWIETKAINAGGSLGAMFRELWNDKALTMYVAAHLAVSYFVTRSTMLASRAFREMVLVNRGYNAFKDIDPLKQITETSMGVLMSFFAKQFITLPAMDWLAQRGGINTNITGKLAEAAYMAGIKSPFAYDAIVDTIYDPDNAAGYLAGGVPAGLLLSFFAMDRVYPVVRKAVAGSLFIVQLTYAYYFNRWVKRPAHA